MIKKLLFTSVACLGTFTFVSAQVSYSENTITHGGVTYKLSTTDISTNVDLNQTYDYKTSNISIPILQDDDLTGYNISYSKTEINEYSSINVTTYVLPSEYSTNTVNLSTWETSFSNNSTDTEEVSYSFPFTWNNSKFEITNITDYNSWKEAILVQKNTIENTAEKKLKLGSEAKNEGFFDPNGDEIIDDCYYLCRKSGAKKAYPIKDVTVNLQIQNKYKNTNCTHKYEVLEIPSTFAIDGTVTSVTIPNTVTSIADEVFANAIGVSTIALENGSDNFSLADVSTDGVRSFYLYRNSDKKLITTCNSSTKRILELPDGYSVLEGANKGNNLTIVDTANQDSKAAAYEAGYIYNAGVNAHLAPSTSLNFTTGYKVMENLNINNEAANCLVFFSETSANGKSISGDNVVVNGTCNNFVITDKVAYNNEVRNFTATNVTYKRTLNNGVWSSVVLPCSFKNTNLKVADLTDFDGNTFTYTILSNQEMATCTPYMIKNTDENTSSIESANHDVTVSMSNASVAKSEINGATFKGTFSETQNNTGNTFYTYNNAGNFVFVKSGAGSKIMPFHSYIEVAKASSAPSIRYIDEMTGTIEEIDNQTAIKAIEENVINNAPIFNMNGNRVAAPVKGQMYINNGKKFIVK